MNLYMSNYERFKIYDKFKDEMIKQMEEEEEEFRESFNILVDAWLKSESEDPNILFNSISKITPPNLNNIKVYTIVKKIELEQQNNSDSYTEYNIGYLSGIKQITNLMKRHNFHINQTSFDNY